MIGTSVIMIKVVLSLTVSITAFMFIFGLGYVNEISKRWNNGA